ncbi:glutamine-fructose-6-phosphate transaminase [Luminiphilus syltensis NOR5-1B]|uniref:Glutamine--fructose-6-phosphate aminotransferase [isomerizing] n=1 Tax=Luminiphilus syltensis NOR5-1B TaxID=565045 RepID=B8KUC7_9GAMM|nr:glutamine--fructose-6-phosphate transaminase (isomerizing) [Luminiphilus syltensis]EED36057.1 glutamine-fructose-6-phosphate transaminase [Luminiphilus syltensis NOR5-1B]
MCGIVAATTKREISEVLLEGLRRLEYRGYDSAGMALIDNEQRLAIHKSTGKVSELEKAQAIEAIVGCTGIAHTRWATHGVPSTVNAHPHVAGERVAVVHNGIIENHGELRQGLVESGAEIVSQTDTEVIVHLIHQHLSSGASLFSAVQQTIDVLEGAFALAVIDVESPDTLIVAREGSPLVLGVGIGETFAGSDRLALQQVTDTFIYLEDGDIAELRPGLIHIFDRDGDSVERPKTRLNRGDEADLLGDYDHYMLKEMFEQPARLEDTVAYPALSDALFGDQAAEVFPAVSAVQIIACGTSYHAGLVARHWIESIAGLPCQVEVASEYRYRQSVTLANTLIVSISQSGETADTLAALKNCDRANVLARLAICNVDHSAIVRESELVFLTRAGAEIGVASTKAFTTQLAALLILTERLATHHRPDQFDAAPVAAALKDMPSAVARVLSHSDKIAALTPQFVTKHHALFLGRGIYHPIAMEGALKLKEISYIHAEAYPAGELKHGPLALVDSDMPVVAVAPNDELLEKLRSNLEEVKARGGQLFVFADEAAGFKPGPGIEVIPMPHCSELVGPVVYTVALQLLSYHVAVGKGTDVDKPRNLAKSVTVE